MLGWILRCFCAVFDFGRNQNGIMFEILKSLEFRCFCYVQVPQLADGNQI